MKFVYEFDDFRVDPFRRVLTRGGETVSLTPKAFSILVALLEQAGEVVEKADLIEKVWPGAFVSEANLTQNIFSLRKSLGERANDTRYVLTVPGRGYSFTAEVRRVEKAATTDMPLAAEPAAAPAPSAVPAPAFVPSVSEAPAAEPAPALAPLPVQLPPAAPSRRTAVVWVLVLAMMAVGAILFTRIRSSDRPEPRPAALADAVEVRPAIAVLDFKSLSPNPVTRWMETAIPEMLTTELAAGGRLRVIRGETVAQALRSLGLQDPAALRDEDLGKLREALGTDLVVLGSYLALRDKLRVDLRVLRVPQGETVTSLAEVGTQPSLFELVARSGSRLRDALGVEALSPEQARQALALRPSNPEASRLYLEGLAHMRAFDPPGALAILQKAAEADPSSAAIRVALSRTWSYLGYDARAADQAREAVRLSASLSREQRLAIEARLHQVTKDWAKASETYRSLWTFYPDDIEYGLQLADCLTSAGRGQEAAATLEELRRLPPPAGQDPRIDLAETKNARRLSDLATQQRAAETAAEKGLRSGQRLIVSQARIYQGDALLRTGKPREALAMFREARDLAEQSQYQWGVGQALGNIGTALRALGDLDGAEESNRKSLEVAQSLGSAVGIAVQLYVLAILKQDRGDLDEALSLLDQSHRWYVDIGDRYMQARVLNAAGTILTIQGEPMPARERFEEALRLSRATGNRAEEAQALYNLGRVLALQGELGESRRRHEQALALLSVSGDQGLAASALASEADVLARLGDLAAAWERSTRALEQRRQSGDKLGIGRILGSRSRLAFWRGDLAAARALAEEQLRIALDTGARPLTASASQVLGRIAFAAGNLSGARRTLEGSLQESLAVGETLRATEIRLDLASLALAAGHPAQASLLAREGAAWYRARKIREGEAHALVLLAESLARQGLGQPAREAAARARDLLARSEDQELRLALAVSLARVDAGAGRSQDALRELRQTSEEAARRGFVSSRLEARLALGEVQRGLGDPQAGALLEDVRREAEARGFKRLASRAAGPAVPPRLAGTAR